MRKADYAALAAILRDRIDSCRARGEIVAESEIRLMTYELSQTLSVNRAEFLRACGLEP